MGYRNLCAAVNEKQVTGTSPTTVLTFTPRANGNFKVDLYFRVKNANTNVTITLSWTDAAGAQTATILPNTTEPVQSYAPVMPSIIGAVAGSPIAVVVTAGTANNVYVSGTISPA